MINRSKRLPWRLALLLAALCATAHAQDLSAAMPGDLIFREGTEVISDAVRAVDDGEFSHVGMLIGSPGQWRVLHATPSEVSGRGDGVTIDSLAFFVDAVRARRYAVYHVHATAEQHARAQLQALGKLGRKFRIADPAGTYCTALVWDSWRAAGVDLQVTFTTLRIPFLRGRYLLPSALQRSPLLTPLHVSK